MIRSALLAVFLAVPSGVFAEINVYIHSSSELKKEGLKVSDIASVDCPAESAAIKDVEINGPLYSDGYVDRAELLQLLKKQTDERINIYGSAARILPVSGEGKDDGKKAETAVKNGSQVKFTAMKNGIRIELTGTAMRDGAVGDVIPVRLRKNKTASGKITEDRKVELEL
ncbi:MAG: flagella basal body P-ring formation protein FlgA [Spirochaetes bacterium]|jgi:hypothetical protein|nr:flagella basal body P-ring formation protein FlgA [Spirochaetota bacterium]